MAREITGAAVAKVAQALATEPLFIVEIFWGYGGSAVLYADRMFDGIEGKIQSVSGLDSIVGLGSKGASGSLSLTLIDTDGTIKEILNTKDVQKSRCNVYQTYGSLTNADRFLLLTGEINTPIVWDEGERTVTFDIVVMIEDREIGFSPEQGEFDFIADSAVGVAWPLCFGSPIRVPSVKITEKVRGVSLTRYGLITLSNLQDLCARAASYADALRQKTRNADTDPGFSDENYAAVCDSIASAAESLNLLLEALIADSPTQATDLRTYRDLCIEISNTEANQNLWFAEYEEADATVTAATETLNALTAQLAEANAAVPKDLVLINSLQTQITETQTELSNAEADKQNYHTLWLAAGSSLAIYAEEKIVLEDRITEFILTEMAIDGGEDFPQGTSVSVIVNGMKLQGSFSDNLFTITNSNLPLHEAVEITASSNANEFYVVDDSIDLRQQFCFFPGVGVVYVNSQETTRCFITPILWYQSGQLAPLDGILIDGEPVVREIYDFRYLSGEISQTAVILRGEWVDALRELDVPDFAKGISQINDQDYSIEIGDEVYLAEDYQDTYIANLIPSTSIQEVMAWRTINGVRLLSAVPERYYTVDLNESIAGQNATTIRLQKPLSEYVDQEWEDQLYVSLTSSEGPNTVDCIEYIVDTYTDFDADATSFAAVRTALDPLPSHFAILDRPDALTVIDDIAWQARCATFLSNEEIYIRYLASDEAAEATITESDIEVQTLALEFTETEELVTKFTALWRTDMSAEEPNKLIIRNNIPKYGKHEQEYDIFIYNIKELVLKTATFWGAIRYPNTWKIISFTSFLTKLKLEQYDPVTLNLTAGLIASGAVKGQVTEAVYNSGDASISFTIWTSVRAGEMTTYPLAFPASASVDEEYPTANDPFAGGA